MASREGAVQTRTRPVVAHLVVTLGAPLFFCALVVALAPPVAGQPNIVLIVSDDAGYNDFGFMAALNGRPSSARASSVSREKKNRPPAGMRAADFVFAAER